MTAYKEVLKSIITTGSQYWSLGERTITNTGKFKIRFKKGNVSSLGFLTGDNPNSSMTDSICVWTNQTAVVVQNGANTRVNLTLANDVDADLEIHSDKYVLNGTTTAITQATEFSQTKNLYIGKATGDANDRHFIGSLSLIQHWNASEIKDIDIVPVLDIQDRPCLYDRVADELIYANTQDGLTYERWNMVEVDYIENTSQSYIMTGLYPGGTKLTAEVKFKASASAVSSAVYPCVFSCFTDESATASANVYNFGIYNQKWRYKLVQNQGYGGNADTNEHIIYWNTDNGTYLDDGSPWIASRIIVPSSNNKELPLFTRNTVGIASDASFRGRIYYAKFWNDSNVLVRDYIPCVINGTGYMYDRVENRLADSTGTFTTPSAYDSNGNFYIVNDGVLTISKGATGTGVMPSFSTNCVSDLGITETVTAVVINDDMTKIGLNAFNGCASLASVTIGNGVTEIVSNSFNGCASLASVTIPDSVTFIGNGAFMGCTSLTSVTIGNGVTDIMGSAFRGCTSLTAITFKSSTPCNLGSSVFYMDPLESIYVPSASVDIYKAAWPDYASLIQSIPTPPAARKSSMMMWIITGIPGL